ncbi:Protocadherin Fat 4 [Mizuhopecten yessoensis]|uniref:Protocadherin Fat 4 n=1 Tax=Mizuhopecten yessoensis TaxID=6573 RepID=A0A210PVS3_MIZYE|nr:Protocadherin Fat 4 [Mizuhopecten yessoensis]
MHNYILIEIPLGANCTVTPTACNESNSECVQGTCVCANGYFDSNGAADAGGCLSTLALGQTCSIGIPDQCADMNADCSGKGVLSCSCKEGFYRSPGGICAAQLALGGSCDSDVSDQCADQNARCGDSDTCVCTAGFYEVGSICSAKLGLGAACNNVKGECETADSECNEKCVCTTGFYDSNGAEPDGTCTPRGNEPELKTYECSLTLIQQFTIEMNDPNSDVAKSIVADLKIILQASLGNTLLAVVLLRLTEGSVNVDYEVTLSSPVTPEALKTAVVNGQKAELNNLAFIVKIDPNSINFNESVQVPCVKTGSNRTDILLNGRCGDHSETGVCVTPNSACVERFGEWSCRCESGFIQTKDQRSCTPVPKVLFAYPNLTVSLQVPKPVGTPIFTIPFANDVANLCTDVPEVNFIKAFTENNFRYEVNCSAVTVILDSALSSSDASFALGIQTKMAFSDLVVADKIVAILETWSDVSIPTELCVTVADGMFSGQLLATLPTLRSGDSYNAPESVKYRLSGENVYSKIAISLTTITGQSSITAYLDTFDITYGSKILTLKVLIIRASMVVTKRENTKSKVIEYSISDPFTLASSDIPLTNLTLGSSDVSIGPGGLDFESGLSPIIFNIEVSVCSMTASTKVVLHITDVNDNPPQFSDTTYSFDIFPTSLSGLLVGVVQATDIDTMTTLTYSVDSSFFSINHQGVIQTLARTELIPFRDISGESKYSANILINVTASDGVKDNTADVIVNLSRQPGTNLGLNFIANVFENMPPGTPVVRANVSGFISYEFASSRAEEYFTINQTTGEVLTKKRLDRENQNEQKLQFAITAFKSSETSCSLTVLGDIEVVVDDVNDNAPVFERSKYTGKIEEGSSTGRTVKVDSGITATDADENPSFTFAIASSNFAIHPETGVITTISELDREVIDIVTLVVTADDGVNTGSVSINITVTDINDNTPTFDFTSGDWRSTSISEGASIGNVVTTVTANDLDEDENGRVFYRIQGDSGYFRIDNRLSGKITVAQITVAHSLDRETIPFHNFTLLARDNGSPLRSVTTTMVVRIIDVNDNDPVFDSAALIADIPEDKSIGSSLFNVSASDKDEGVNGDIASYNFISGNEDGIFSIDNDGVIRCDKNLDYETTTEYKLVTVAKDNGKTPRSSSSTVTIRVTDVNDNAPYFTQDISTGAHYIKIKKSDFSGQAEKPIMVVTALDRDSGLNGQINKPINMSLPTGLSLTLNSSGVMRTKTSDPPIKNLTVILIAMDKGNPPLTSTATLTLEIVEDDSSSGKVKFNLQDIQMSIPENIPNIDIGTLSGDVTSQNGKTVIFDKVSGAENVKVESSGNIKVEDPFDREAIQSTVIVVRATVEDDTDLALVTVTVTDMNDNHPTFGSTDKYRRILKEDIPINTNIVNVLAKDEDEGLNQKITYTIVGSDACFSHFAINSATGVMTLKKNLDREGAFALCDFSVEAADAGSPYRLTAVVPVEVTIQDVNDNSPIFSDQSSGGGYDITVKEDLRISDETESFGFIRDEDIGENGDIDVSVTLDSDCPFTAKLNITTVDIFKIIFTLTSALDFETVRLHTCEVLVFDKGTPSLTSTVDVKVTVTDVNDNAPVFSAKTYAVNVSRDASIDQTLIDEINATDVESQDLTFLFAPTKKDDIAYKDYFSFNFKTASITVKSKLVDFQRDEVVLYVSILITDDNIRPVFDDPEATLQLTEHSSVVNPVFTALATDREGRKGPELCQCIYRFKNPSDIFEINNTTGKISVIQGTDIDREKTAEVTLNVIATDPGGKDSLPLRLNITILDINDHSPVFTDIRDGDYRFILLQVVPVGSTVGTVIAEDADAGENAIPVYSLRGARYSWSPFMNDLADLFNTMPVSISTTNGTITTIASLDINASRNFYIELVVRAEDSKDSLKVTETKVIVQVDYLDPNGYHPKFAHELYRISLPKSSNIGTDLDINVTATDLDTGADGRVSYSIAAGNTRDIFSINSMTGHLSVAFVIDIAADLVNLTIQAEDGGIMPKRGYCSVEIYLTGNAIECSNAVVGTEDKWFTAMTVLAAVLGVCFTVLLVLIFYFIKLRHSYKYPQGPEAYARKQSIYTANLDRSMVHDDGDYAHFSLPSGTFPGNTVPSAGQPFSIYRSMDSLGDDQSGQTRTNRSIEGSVNGFQDFYQHTAQRRNCRANSDSSSNFSDYEPADNPVSPRASSRPPAPHELTNPLSVSFLEPENRSFRRSTYREPTPDY